MRRGEVALIDVRPPDEYRAGHIPGARNVPLADLPRAMASLPRGREIVAYCRGPYCVLAPQAVELLARHGRRARRLAVGLPEWREDGQPVAVGSEA
jgi:rhodanese-related sulfurtransferase